MKCVCGHGRDVHYDRESTRLPDAGPCQEEGCACKRFRRPRSKLVLCAAWVLSYILSLIAQSIAVACAVVAIALIAWAAYLLRHAGRFLPMCALATLLACAGCATARPCVCSCACPRPVPAIPESYFHRIGGSIQRLEERRAVERQSDVDEAAKAAEEGSK